MSSIFGVLQRLLEHSALAPEHEDKLLARTPSGLPLVSVTQVKMLSVKISPLCTEELNERGIQKRKSGLGARASFFNHQHLTDIRYFHFD